MTTERRIEILEKRIAIMKAFVAGEQVQMKFRETDLWIDIPGYSPDPFSMSKLCDYRIKPTAVVTPEELKGMNRRWYKSKQTGRIYCEMQINECMENAADPNLYFRLNPKTTRWEEWSNDDNR